MAFKRLPVDYNVFCTVLYKHGHLFKQESIHAWEAGFIEITHK